MMTASDLVKADEAFPVLTGDIEQDTEAIIGELAVGTYVVERGLARLYMVWKSKSFLSLTESEYSCPDCGMLYAAYEVASPNGCCPNCGGCNSKENKVPIYPTLEAYIGYVSDETGKSRQTIFNRLKAYRVLCEDRNVTPESVFKLNLLSSGAASKLASADDDGDNLVLENGSWQETVDTALGAGTKSGALQYVKYDVLLETKMSSVFDAAKNTITVYREYNKDGSDQFVLEEFHLALNGSWPEQVRDWLVKRLGAKVE